MKNFILSLLCVVTISAQALAQSDAKAQEVLKKAKAAIGKESKFAELQSLSASGTSRRTMGERQMESNLEIELIAPDKIKKVESNDFFIATSTINGAEYWSDRQRGLSGGGGGGGPTIVMGGGGGQGGQNSSISEYFQKLSKNELNLLLISWFVTPLPSSQTTFTYVGEAPGPNGKTDVIDAKNADGITTRLYFDQESHLLVGLSYKAKNMMRMMGGRGPGGPGGPGGQGGQSGQGARQGGGQGQAGQGGQRSQMTEEEREKMRKEREEAFTKAPETDVKWAFDDFKPEGGLNIPHKITRIVDGNPIEEIEIFKVKINPKLNPENFVKK